MLSENDGANGYANRFLFFCVRRSKFLPIGGDVPQVDFGRLQDRISEAVDFARQQPRMTFTQDASALWMTECQRLLAKRYGGAILDRVIDRMIAQDEYFNFPDFIDAKKRD